MKRFLLRGKIIIITFVVLAVVAGIQEIVYYDSIGGEVVWEGTATVVGWEVSSAIKMIVDCDGQEGYTFDKSIIVDYLNNPGPLQCILYESGKVRLIE